MPLPSLPPTQNDPPPDLWRGELGAAVSLTTSSRVGRFDLLRKLGAGGMGVVYAAYDPELDRRVAIKLVSVFTRTRDAKEQLLREAQAVARLSHPNVVSIYEVGRYHDQVYLAMELVEGETLRVWSGAAQRSWRETLDVYLQAGRGLAAAHAAGVVHRDFKPDNALIGDDGRVRVVDFGLARADDYDSRDFDSSAETVPTRSPADAPDTGFGRLIGTPAYMSPEQFLHGAVDERADQFGFCVALHEALHGERPFAGDTVEEVRENVLLQRLRPPPAGSRVPRRIRAAIVRGLSLDPRDRWPTMNALLAALARDPWQRYRRWLAASALGALSLTTLSLALADPRAQICVDEAAAMSWDFTRRTAVKQAILESGIRDATGTWARLEERLDGYARGWAALSFQVCAQDGAPEPAASFLDPRRTCLRGHRRAFEALVHELERGDRDTAERALEAAYNLPSLERCVDDRYLQARVKPPERPALAAAVEQLRSRLAEAQAKLDSGDVAGAEQLCALLLADALGLGDGRVLAEVYLLQGSLASNRGDVRESAQAHTQAIHRALSVGDDILAAEAAMELPLDGHEASKFILNLIEDLFTRTGALPRDWARLEYKRAQHRCSNFECDPNDLRRMIEGLHAYERTDGKQPREHFSRLMHVAAIAFMLDDPRAEEYYLRALDQARALFSSSYPEVSFILSNLAVLYLDQRRLDEAEQFALWARDVGKGLRESRGPLNARWSALLAEIALERGDLAACESRLAPALAQTTDSAAPPGIADVDAHNTAARLYLLRGDLARAQEHARRLLAVGEATGLRGHVSLAYSYSAEIALREGRTSVALDEARRAVEHAGSKPSPQFGRSRLILGEVLLALGHLAEAEAALDAALYELRLQASPPELLGRTRFALARTREADPSRASALAAQAALDFAAGGPALARDHAAVMNWLAR